MIDYSQNPGRKLIEDKIKQGDFVFVSYSRKDQKLVGKVVGRIMYRFASLVWWDGKIETGDDFTVEIENALVQSDLVIVLWTKESIKSTFVIDEARRAAEMKKLFPVTVDGVSPPIGLGGLQSVDLPVIDEEPNFTQFDKAFLHAFRHKAAQVIFEERGEVRPIFNINEVAHRDSNAFRDYIQSTRICLVHHERNSFYLMNFKISLSSIGFEVNSAVSNGEYSGDWHKQFMDGLKGAQVLLLPYFPIEAETRYYDRSIENEFIRSYPIIHMPFSSLSMNDLKGKVSLSLSQKSNNFFKLKNDTLNISRVGAGEAWKFVNLVLESSRAAKI